ncbi:hypothetical protein WR25_20622 [Diploscapter pachys]|uniref:SXP/RAL-2 family protein Ani s 5-like cation-binding domain-containing protein n=1 Tax=Diploscapter pachys TaxID=2018661 RepID=A0A2A2KZG2_9BILA|nr:hypothetical protein WR25_20622 [Diploscapter pachys]
MRFYFLVVSAVIVSFAAAGFFDDAIGTVSNGAGHAVNWVKDTAAPAVGGAVSSAANAVVDPDNHKAVKDWVVDKADKVSNFTTDTVVPGAKHVGGKIANFTTEEVVPGAKRVGGAIADTVDTTFREN